MRCTGDLYLTACSQGIVSRITMARYAYALNKLLGIQIDAAINPGKASIVSPGCQTASQPLQYLLL